MEMLAMLLCAGLLIAQLASAEIRQFPEGFQFGVATSAFQIEGAWNVSDKAESIWDRAAHIPGKIEDGTDAEIACDSYHQIRRDVQMVRELGVDFYRFSISWPRLLPNGFADKISEDGKRYYTELIDEVLKYNITPFVTIYHWDLPAKLQDMGGWANPLIVDWFEDYARVVFDLFADKVKLWITINEPLVICAFAYGKTGYGSPLETPSGGIADYMCTKNAFLAHARVWHLFDQHYRPKYGGSIGYSNLMPWFEAATQEDNDLAELANQFYTGLYSHPVFSAEGGWPPAVEELVAANSRRQGYPRSRLPALTQREKDYIRGSSDFYGVQHYVTKLVNRTSVEDSIWPLTDEIGVDFYSDPNWEKTNLEVFQPYPPGFRHLLNFIKQRYGSPRIFISESGCPSLPGLHDDQRIKYVRDYLNQLLDAIYLDGVNVTHYSVWSLMDNFEWSDGLRTKFGLYEVDFSDANRTRTARKSALVYKRIATTNTLDPDYEPTSFDISVCDNCV